MSPNRARAEIVRSTPLKSTAPATATPMPVQACAGTCSPRPRAMSAAHTGWVATSATEDATDVNERLGTQVAKWAASSNPAVTARRRSRPVSRWNSAEWRDAVHGTSTPIANVLRQKATASVGAAASRTRGAEVDTAATANARSARSVPDGRARLAVARAGCIGFCLPHRERHREQFGEQCLRIRRDTPAGEPRADVRQVAMEEVERVRAVGDVDRLGEVDEPQAAAPPQDVERRQVAVHDAHLQEGAQVLEELPIGVGHLRGRQPSLREAGGRGGRVTHVLHEHPAVVRLHRIRHRGPGLPQPAHDVVLVPVPALVEQRLAVPGHGRDRPDIAAAPGEAPALAVHVVVAEGWGPVEAELLQLALVGDGAGPVALERQKAGPTVDRGALDDGDLGLLAGLEDAEIDVGVVVEDDPIGDGSRQRRTPLCAGAANVNGPRAPLKEVSREQARAGADRWDPRTQSSSVHPPSASARTKLGPRSAGPACSLPAGTANQLARASGPRGPPSGEDDYLPGRAPLRARLAVGARCRGAGDADAVAEPRPDRAPQQR